MDTSVWIDHLYAGDEALGRLLETDDVVIHPFVIGELALGSIPQRDVVMDGLLALPQIDVADPDEVLHFIDTQGLVGSGLGYVDVHLLVALRVTGGARLWTRDKRLRAVADRLDLTYTPSGSGVVEPPAAYG